MIVLVQGAACACFSRRTDAMALNQRLSGLSRSGKWREALQLVGDESVQQCLDDKHVNVAVSACARAGRWREALDLPRERVLCLRVLVQKMDLDPFRIRFECARTESTHMKIPDLQRCPVLSSSAHHATVRKNNKHTHMLQIVKFTCR